MICFICWDIGSATKMKIQSFVTEGRTWRSRMERGRQVDEPAREHGLQRFKLEQQTEPWSLNRYIDAWLSIYRRDEAVVCDRSTHFCQTLPDHMGEDIGNHQGE